MIYCVVCDRNLYTSGSVRMFDNSFCSTNCSNYVYKQYTERYAKCVANGEFYCVIGNCYINVTLFKVRD